MKKRIIAAIVLSGMVATSQAQDKPTPPPQQPPMRRPMQQRPMMGPQMGPQDRLNRDPRAMMPIKNPDRSFSGFKQAFIQNMWRVYPGWASSVGFHRYDSVLVVPDGRARQEEMMFCHRNLEMLKRFTYDSLGPTNKTDYKLIENQLNYTLFNLTELNAWEWDPSQYNVCGSFADMLGNNYDSLDRRLHNFYIRLGKVPAYYAAAKANINGPSKEHIDLAIEQNEGGISVFKSDLDEALAKSKLSKEEKGKIKGRADSAVKAIQDYVSWLKTVHPGRSFRLGKELYEKKFAFELQSGYSADEIYQKALKHKEELHAEMYKITQQLWPKYMKSAKMPADKLAAIKQLIDRLSANHVKPQEFQSAIENQLPVLSAFVSKKKLLYIDPSKPLVVRKEPAYMAGVAGASINAPGPYDKNGNTYYNVGSLEGWDGKKAESYLREYNHYILQILNIHEAIPGHYTQLVYANRSPSIVKSILGNNAMIEGWAVYTERMMLENGYDGDNPDATEASPEMWLMYYKWNLRSTCNMILDHDVHAKQMEKQQAMQLLQREAFQEQAEAEGKWKRVSVTQVQLGCYFTGYTEIYELREEMKNKQKDKFNLQAFHERFLSYGSAPVKYIKELMLTTNVKAEE